MKKIGYIIVFITALLTVSCSEKVDTSGQNTQIQELESMIDELQKEVKEKSKNIDEYNSVINELELNIERLEEINNENMQLQSEAIDYSGFSYIEDEKIYNSSNMYLLEKEELKVLPHMESESINTLFPSAVRVITTVRNSINERWALIEFIESSFGGENGYGYIPYNSLHALDDKHYYHRRTPEGINGIFVGDYKENVIAKLGKDYYIEKNEMEWSLNYSGLEVILEHTTEQVVGFRVNDKGYYLNTDIKVGSNAMDAIEYYKDVYQMNGEVEFNKDLPDTAFRMGDEYFLLIEYDTEYLSEISKITNIRICPIDWIYG